MPQPTITVTGAGFSGTALTLWLQSSCPVGTRIYLIERGHRFAAGRAYATENPKWEGSVIATEEGEGATAAAKGRSITCCPYVEGDSRRDQWMKGWRAVMEKCRISAPDYPWQRSMRYRTAEMHSL
jgi:ribosome modulation factor